VAHLTYCIVEVLHTAGSSVTPGDCRLVLLGKNRGDPQVIVNVGYYKKPHNNYDGPND